MSIPLTVSKFMTRTPFKIEASASLDEARRLMKEKDIRHLPVMDGKRLVGVVSQRDIQLALGFRNVDPELTEVQEAMIQDVFAVAGDAELESVARKMAERRLGSAVVVDRRHVVGIFTTVDALRALHTVLRRERASHPDGKPRANRRKASR